MAQHDYTIANQGFPAFRSDLNDALAAIVSNNSGATEPTTMFAHQMWVDTAADPSVLKIRNADNDAWITIGSIDQTGDTFTLTSAVSATTLNTSGAVVFNDAGADVDFRVEGDTDANLLFVDASTDKVGIGTSSPGQKFTVTGDGGGGAVRMQLKNEGNASGDIVEFQLLTTEASAQANIVFGDPADSDVGELQYVHSDNSMRFLTNAAERMRIDSSGHLLVGTTNTSPASNNVGGGGFIVTPSGTRVEASVNGASLFNRTSSNGAIIVLYRSGVDVGSIDVTTTATSYNTSSDYRLKENVAPMTGALAKVLELNPVTYTWKSDGSAGEGFIAHELQEVAPYAVTGEKDGEEMQGVDYGKITPLLTAALQEAITEIQSLKARVAELEAK